MGCTAVAQLTALSHAQPGCNLCRERHWRVLEWVLFLNTHSALTYSLMHGDKDTFRAGFHLAGAADAFQQASSELAGRALRAGCRPASAAASASVCNVCAPSGLHLPPHLAPLQVLHAPGWALHDVTVQARHHGAAPARLCWHVIACLGSACRGSTVGGP